VIMYRDVRDSWPRRDLTAAGAGGTNPLRDIAGKGQRGIVPATRVGDNWSRHPTRQAAFRMNSQDYLNRRAAVSRVKCF
jgi:hypothetical protein